MTTQRKLTRPGLTDNEYMTVTCTPDETAVEFFELTSEAEDAARVNLHPGTTTYVGKIIKQGQHAVRGTAKYIAVGIEVDDELKLALAARAGHKGNPSREMVAGWIQGILSGHMDGIRTARRLVESAQEVRSTAGMATAVDVRVVEEGYFKAGRYIYGTQTESPCRTLGCKGSVTPGMAAVTEGLCALCWETQP